MLAWIQNLPEAHPKPFFGSSQFSLQEFCQLICCRHIPFSEHWLQTFLLPKAPSLSCALASFCTVNFCPALMNGLCIPTAHCIYFLLHIKRFQPLSIDLSNFNSLGAEEEPFSYLNIQVIYPFIKHILFGPLLCTKHNASDKEECQDGTDTRFTFKGLASSRENKINTQSS